VPRRKRGRNLNGFLLLDKPSGPTSNQVLQRARRILDARKAGHTGTLDPLATGMLPICFGAATRAATYAIHADKHYEATGLLGIATDTADSMGEVIARSDPSGIDAAAIEFACRSFHGEIEQVPPQYSAIRHQGQRMYDLARRGVKVEAPARRVTIHQLSMVAAAPPEFRIRVHCSKGTYIRTLIEDIARRMGTHAHVIRLRRTAVAPFFGRPMVTLEALEAASQTAEGADAALLPVDCVLQHWPSIELEAAVAARVRSGQKVQLSRPLPTGQYRIYGEAAEFVGIGEVSPSAELFPKRIFL
jgi:tRNA pseudouridine55 synthase